MTRSHIHLFFWLVMFASGCASKPPQDHYYSLVLAADDYADNQAEPILADADLPRLTVGPVRLARYLDQPGLTMQMGDNQIRAANNHFWAEPLDEAIGKVLARDLADRTTGLAVDRDVDGWTGQSDCHLRIEFDKFHATDDAKVVAKGRYQLRGPDDAAISAAAFDIAVLLIYDGYGHAVDQLRASIGQLADEIVDTLNIAHNCRKTG